MQCDREMLSLFVFRENLRRYNGCFVSISCSRIVIYGNGGDRKFPVPSFEDGPSLPPVYGTFVALVLEDLFVHSLRRLFCKQFGLQNKWSFNSLAVIRDPLGANFLLMKALWIDEKYEIPNFSKSWFWYCQVDKSS